MDAIELNCVLCGNNFPTTNSLSAHYYNDHSAYFHCEWCSGQFHTVDDVTRHSEKVHVGKAMFKCLWCDHSSRTKKSVAQHRRQIHVQQLREFACHFCSKFFKNTATLKNHKIYIHGEFHLKSEPASPPKQCNKAQNVPLLVPKTGRQVWTNGPQFVPNVNHEASNGSLFVQKSKHQASNEPPFVPKSNHQAQIVPPFDSNPKHYHQSPPADIPKKYQCYNPDGSLIIFHCKYCPKQFDNRVEHCLHSIEFHNAYFMCSFCDMNFKTADLLAGHCKKIHDRYKSYTCIYCWIDFNDLSLLKAHQTFANHNVVMCPFCTKLMPSHECLMVHKEYESNPKEIEDQPTTACTSSANDLCLCLVCFKRVPSVKFEKHSKDHINKEGLPASCNECFMLIVWKNNLHGHLECFQREASRKGPELYHCEFCGYKSVSKAQSSRHYGWCHRPMHCKLCPEQYIGFTGEKVHAASSHGVALRKSQSTLLKQGQINADQTLPAEKLFVTPKEKIVPTERELIDKTKAAKQMKESPSVERVLSKEVKKSSPKNVEQTPKVKREPLSSSEEDACSATKKRKRRKSESVNPVDDEMNGTTSVKELEFEKRMKQLKTELLLLSSDDESSDAPVKRQKKRKSSSTSSSSDDDVSLPEVSKVSKQDKEKKKPVRPPSMSAKVIELDPALFGTSEAAASANPPVEKPATQPKSSTPKGKDTPTTEFVCMLCGNSSVYKQSIRRHVVFIHRIPEDQCVDFCQERIKAPPPIVIRVEKSAESVKNCKDCASQTAKVSCSDCLQLEKKCKKLKTLLKRFMTAATEMNSVLGEKEND